MAQIPCVKSAHEDRPASLLPEYMLRAPDLHFCSTINVPHNNNNKNNKKGGRDFKTNNVKLKTSAVFLYLPVASSQFYRVVFRVAEPAL